MIGGNRFYPLDADALAFGATSGATDIRPLSNLARGIKNLGLWSNFASWPQKSAQNAGTGATVFMLGGASAGSGTLVNGPTWGASGIAYTSASSQYMDTNSTATALGIESTTTAHHIFHRVKRNIGGPWSSSNFNSGNPDNVIGLASVSIVNLRAGAISSNIVGTFLENEDVTVVHSYYSNRNFEAFTNKTSLGTGTLTGADAGNFESNITLRVGRWGNLSSYSDATCIAAVYIKGTISSSQREAITDLINAL
jgi:hypothetical protein